MLPYALQRRTKLTTVYTRNVHTVEKITVLSCCSFIHRIIAVPLHVRIFHYILQAVTPICTQAGRTVLTFSVLFSWGLCVSTQRSSVLLFSFYFSTMKAIKVSAGLFLWANLKQKNWTNATRQWTINTVNQAKSTVLKTIKFSTSLSKTSLTSFFFWTICRTATLAFSNACCLRETPVNVWL